ncbi:hypothetical protein FB451DRAFT_1191806 [Mycena latifolia]|nr:hypothetical protein FB451DRAFT_1191806 [Mycena latifolia]
MSSPVKRVNGEYDPMTRESRFEPRLEFPVEDTAQREGRTWVSRAANRGSSRAMFRPRRTPKRRVDMAVVSKRPSARVRLRPPGPRVVTCLPSPKAEEPSKGLSTPCQWSQAHSRLSKDAFPGVLMALSKFPRPFQGVPGWSAIGRPWVSLRVTLQMSRSSTPTLPWVLPMYEMMLKHLRKSEADTKLSGSLRQAATAGLEKLETYYAKARGCQFNVIATLLHPSLGMTWFRRLDAHAPTSERAAHAKVLFEHDYQSYKEKDDAENLSRPQVWGRTESDV